jgi:hypothetical protein
LGARRAKDQEQKKDDVRPFHDFRVGLGRLGRIGFRAGLLLLAEDQAHHPSHHEGHKEGGEDPYPHHFSAQDGSGVDQREDICGGCDPKEDERRPYARAPVVKPACDGDDRAGASSYEKASAGGQREGFEFACGRSHVAHDGLSGDKGDHSPGQKKCGDKAGEDVKGNVLL